MSSRAISASGDIVRPRFNERDCADSEFMAEPVKPKRRNGKPQPASMSMFEWAMEQEKETVGAGR